MLIKCLNIWGVTLRVITFADGNPVHLQKILVSLCICLVFYKESIK